MTIWRHFLRIGATLLLLTAAARADGLGQLSAGAVIAGPIAFTPSDASGASLTITNNGSYYWRNGKTSQETVNVTYPTTANGSAAQLGGMPCTVSSRIQNGSILAPVYNTASLATLYAAPQGGATAIYLIVSLQFALATNANLTAAQLRTTLTCSTD